LSNPASILFSDWLPVLRVIVVGTAGYFFLLLVLRAAGPRTLAKTSIFDFIMLVSIGSVYGRILTAEEVSLVEACVAYALLTGLHYFVSWLRTRSTRFATFLDAAPVLLYFRGTYVERELRRARMRHSDIEAAVRHNGMGSMASVDAVVLEADGELSIVRKDSGDHELTDKVDTG
jgi:uncharacterized membrane protein YcaP (DUF421 family)